MRRTEEFIESAIKNNIRSWGIHNCSLCDYLCGYIFFSEYHGFEVLYDNGCDCTRRYVIGPRNWENVSDLYNIQKSPEVIKQMNEFWGFKD